MGRTYQQGRINWATAAVMLLFHAGAVAALFCFSWINLAAFAVMYFFAINVGIGMAYHRLLTHRGYRVPRWLEYFFTACGTMALEGGPIFWVATHRVHHQNSDHEGDPHTPRDGAWWSHAGWILSGRALHSETALLGRYAPDLTRDRGHVWLSRFHWLPLALTGIAQLAIGAALAPTGHAFLGGLSMLLWATFLRVTIGLHATWLVNSATHLFGSRRFDTHDDSRNSWWVALLTGGEGWPRLVRVRPQLLRHLAPRQARPRHKSPDRPLRPLQPQARRRPLTPPLLRRHPERSEGPLYFAVACFFVCHSRRESASVRRIYNLCIPN
jgi:stearoyl-CoA desaturase (delta-9 desaturase)